MLLVEGPHLGETALWLSKPTERAMTTGDTPLLTVLSYGGGQDSTAILLRLIHDDEFRQRWAPGRLLVVMSDTGNEHPDTYAYVRRMKKYCAEKQIEFWFLTNDLGFHSEAWQTLQDQYERTSTCGSKCGFNGSCSDNLKIKPFYRFLERWISMKYNFPEGDKKATKAFAAKYGKIRVLIGIAKGEEKRVAKAEVKGKLYGQWFVQAIDRQYPLIEAQMDREACQQYIRSVGMPVPPPSNCMRCHWKSEIEVLWTHRNLPEEFEAWVANENAKKEKFKHLGDRNMGVFGRKPLTVVLADAEKKYEGWSDEQLEEYRMSHGHCNTTY